jgi:hypothetical protein
MISKILTSLAQGARSFNYQNEKALLGRPATPQGKWRITPCFAKRDPRNLSGQPD